MAIVACFLAFLLTTSSASSDNNISFSFSSFEPNQQDVKFQGAATVMEPSIQLTGKNLNNSNGWAMYYDPMHLWDSSTGTFADFSTRFSFIINSQNSFPFADGFTFFLAPNGSQMPADPQGGDLALPNSSSSSYSYVTNFPFIAVEFDTFTNSWDPGYNGSLNSIPHIGIDVNSVTSNVTEMWEWNNVMGGGQAQAWITYDSSAGNLSVLLVDESDPNNLYKEDKNISRLSFQVNLSTFLPEWVTFGFSGSTGFKNEIHQIISWEFNSSLQITSPVGTSPAPAPQQVTVPPQPTPSIVTGKEKSKTWVWIVVSCEGAIVLFITIAVFAWFRHSSKEVVERANEEGDGNAAELIDEELEKMAGPRKFSYNELAIATDDFAESRLLGEGGFGKVYEGHLSGMEENKVAIKRITADSEQGLQEYAAELKTVSQLRHRSLVQLLG